MLLELLVELEDEELGLVVFDEELETALVEAGLVVFGLLTLLPLLDGLVVFPVDVDVLDDPPVVPGLDVTVVLVLEGLVVFPDGLFVFPF